MSAAPKKFVLSKVVAEAAVKHPDIQVEVSEKLTVSFPPPQRWSDEVVDLAADAVALTKKLLGADYAAFVAGGGSAMLLLDVIKDASGVSLGESSAS
jgi:hypothetical protein